MAISDLWKKEDTDETKPKDNIQYGPKVIPPRGPGGKFVSKKKPQVNAEDVKKIEDVKVVTGEKKTATPTATKKSTLPKGPYTVPFGGSEVRRYWKNGKWYFALQDLLLLGYADPPYGPVSELKGDKKTKALFDEHISQILDTDCVDVKGGTEIIRQIIQQYDANFPGQILRWIEDISNLPFTESEEEPTEQPAPMTEGNPSDRG